MHPPLLALLIHILVITYYACALGIANARKPILRKPDTSSTTTSKGTKRVQWLDEAEARDLHTIKMFERDPRIFGVSHVNNSNSDSAKQARKNCGNLAVEAFRHAAKSLLPTTQFLDEAERTIAEDLHQEYLVYVDDMSRLGYGAVSRVQEWCLNNWIVHEEPIEDIEDFMHFYEHSMVHMESKMQELLIRDYFVPRKIRLSKPELQTKINALFKKQKRIMKRKNKITPDIYYRILALEVSKLLSGFGVSSSHDMTHWFHSLHKLLNTLRVALGQSIIEFVKSHFDNIREMYEAPAPMLFENEVEDAVKLERAANYIGWASEMVATSVRHKLANNMTWVLEVGTPADFIEAHLYQYLVSLFKSLCTGLKHEDAEMAASFILDELYKQDCKFEVQVLQSDTVDMKMKTATLKSLARKISLETMLVYIDFIFVLEFPGAHRIFHERFREMEKKRVNTWWLCEEISASCCSAERTRVHPWSS